MEITWDQINEIAELAATKAVEKYKANEVPPVFRTKVAIAQHIGCDRRTIDAMISRGEVIITKDNRYTIPHAKLSRKP